MKSLVPTSDGEHLVVEVVISQTALAKFRAKFGQRRQREGRLNNHNMDVEQSS